MKSEREMQEVVVALIQMRIGLEVEENISVAKEMVEEAVVKNEEVEVVCFPEYFFAPSSSFCKKTPKEVHYEASARTRELLEELSEDYGIIIGGTVIEEEEGRFFNTCFVYEQGRLIGKQRKVHLTEGEIKWGLTNSMNFEVIRSKVGNIGVLVCADVLYPEACRILGLKRADIVLNPVISQYKEKDVTREARKCLFVSRAYDNGYFILKTGSVGLSPFGKRAVGRSLIASPWGIVANAEDEDRAGIIVASLDMGLLEEVRETTLKATLKERVRGAYKALVE
ncbi:MAG: carbon-nitrogen hydrolase family protein [Candidatus Methanospirareceae archaeon]